MFANIVLVAGALAASITCRSLVPRLRQTRPLVAAAKAGKRSNLRHGGEVTSAALTFVASFDPPVGVHVEWHGT